MQTTCGQLDLMPLQIANLGSPQAVAVREQGHGGVAMPVPAPLAGRRHQVFDLTCVVSPRSRLKSRPLCSYSARSARDSEDGEAPRFAPAAGLPYGIKNTRVFHPPTNLERAEWQLGSAFAGFHFFRSAGTRNADPSSHGNLPSGHTKQPIANAGITTHAGK